MQSQPFPVAEEIATSDREAFIEEALVRYESPLLRYAYSLTGDLEAAQDVVQDTFLRLWEQSPESVAPFLNRWLYTVCRNRALDIRRKSRRMVELNEFEWEQQAARDASPAEVAALSDSAAAVVRLLPNLSANQREVLRLRFQMQMSYQEISGITDLSVTNVGFLLHTALKTLRQQLEALDRAAGSKGPTVVGL